MFFRVINIRVWKLFSLYLNLRHDRKFDSSRPITRETAYPNERFVPQLARIIDDCSWSYVSVIFCLYRSDVYSVIYISAINNKTTKYLFVETVQTSFCKDTNESSFCYVFTCYLVLFRRWCYLASNINVI